MYLLFNKNKNMSETLTPHQDKPNQEATGYLLDASGVELSELLELQTEDLNALFQDPAVKSVSFRRHGAYERSQDSVQRGQLTQETMPDVKAAAHEWVSLLPEGVKLDFVTSPTGMPATGPTGNRLMPARARMTGALYGVELRDRFGEDFTRLAGQLDQALLDPRRQRQSHHVFDADEGNLVEMLAVHHGSIAPRLAVEDGLAEQA